MSPLTGKALKQRSWGQLWKDNDAEVHELPDTLDLQTPVVFHRSCILQSCVQLPGRDEFKCSIAPSKLSTQTCMIGNPHYFVKLLADALRRIRNFYNKPAVRYIQQHPFLQVLLDDRLKIRTSTAAGDEVFQYSLEDDAFFLTSRKGITEVSAERAHTFLSRLQQRFLRQVPSSFDFMDGETSVTGYMVLRRLND